LKGILVTERLEDLYHVGRVLGEGKYGVVRIVEKKNYDKIRFAMKEINVEPEQMEF
jgi:bifunctional N-acetylglucosamine-1-phosphate-uridyltransferase/glucosamine-1-phosphate-acetyltransferase GlmU-like protein